MVGKYKVITLCGSTRFKDAFIEAQYKEVRSLYHLDQRSAGNMAGEKKDLGPLPGESKALLTVLIVAWVLIGLIICYNQFAKK